MDRTAFRINTYEEADNNTAYWLTRPPAERLRAASYLIRQAWNLAPDDPMRVDRNAFKIKKRSMSNNIFSLDLQELIQACNDHDVEYILVGGYAVILHGYNRTTGDIDVWINPTKANYDKLLLAFDQFQMPIFDMSEKKFLAIEDYDVFSFGLPPNAIDLMTSVKGLDFESAYENSYIHEFDDLDVRVVQYDDLISAKKAAGRPRDVNDVERLEKGRND